MKNPNYKTKYIAGVRFSAYAMHRLDLQRWNQESENRQKKIKLDFHINKNNPNFKFDLQNYPLRPMPRFLQQTRFCLKKWKTKKK